jgi:hypothetical protein
MISKINPLIIGMIMNISRHESKMIKDIIKNRIIL